MSVAAGVLLLVTMIPRLVVEDPRLAALVVEEGNILFATTFAPHRGSSPRAQRQIEVVSLRGSGWKSVFLRCCDL